VTYGIIVNPAAGQASIEKKRRTIDRCARVLGGVATIAGWETDSPEQLRDLANQIAADVDVLIVAGGDGTLSDIINTVDSGIVLAYLPMGSGNAWRNTLGLPRSVVKAAQQIRNGKKQSIDLVLCDGKKKGLLASVGFEGHTLQEREKYLENGVTGFDAYARATAKSIFGGYKGADAAVVIDGDEFQVPNVLSIIVSKSQFYGYGIKIIPTARLADGFLHALIVSGHAPAAISDMVTSLFGSNGFTGYKTCRELSITTHEDLYLQIDGNLERRGTTFAFRILPSALTLLY
jgi:diacylglycerol kinase family enzyme